MLWQDYVLAIGQLMLAIGLIPTIMGKSKPAFITSIISGAVLLTFGFVFYTLSLWASASMASLQAVFWFIIAYQQLVKKKAKSEAALRPRLKRSIRTAKNG